MNRIVLVSILAWLALSLQPDHYARAQDAAPAIAAEQLDAGVAAPPVTVTAPATSEVTVTPAAAEPAPKPDAPAVVDAAHDVQHGSWRYALSGLIVALMAALQKARAKVPFFAGQRGGAILVGLLSLGGSFSTVLAASVPLTPELLLGAVGITWTAVGGWHWFRDLIAPSAVSSAQAVVLLTEVDAWINDTANEAIPQALRAKIRAAIPKAPVVA